MIKQVPIIAIALLITIGACSIPSKPQQGQAATQTQLLPNSMPGQPISPTSTEGALLKPIITGNSVEICLNSRYSIHSLTGTASDQQIANILWAAGKSPVTGSHRDIYLTTPQGQFLYNPGTNTLSRHSDQGVIGGALMMNCDSERAFDTGIAYMLAMLSAVSLWKSSEPAVASCPKLSNLFFGVQDVRGLTTELVVHSSVSQGDTGWLPDPSTNGNNGLEDVLENLKYVDKFSQDNLTLQQVSQLLWAGYGCTPHEVAGGRKGLTVPSAMAAYYLTNTIYLVNDDGVYRYHNRKPDTDMATRDHRLEQLRPGDVRSKVQAAVGSLPSAPCYIAICLGQSAAGARNSDWAMEEAGFVAGNMLVQASAIGLGCNFKTGLTQDEQAGIHEATSIPSSDSPQVVISLGASATR